MNIKILGNGGAINSGLFYNAFLIDDTILCETPPDIMHSLYNQAVDIDRISTVYISHFHGDHFFGFPFLMLNLFYRNYDKQFHRISVIGPQGIRQRLDSIYSTAFDNIHPGYHWMLDHCTFHEIGPGCTVIGSYRVEFHPMEHSVPTFGLLLSNSDGECLFGYMPDTLWSDTIDRMLQSRPKAVLIDVNGRRDDVHKIHCSIDDIVEFGLPATGEATMYYGTHLQTWFTVDHPHICICKPGDECTV